MHYKTGQKPVKPVWFLVNELDRYQFFSCFLKRNRLTLPEFGSVMPNNLPSVFFRALGKETLLSSAKQKILDKKTLGKKTFG
jgi:hypothetical protein